MKIIFLGKDNFGNIVLQKLKESGYEPVSGNLEDVERIRPDLVIVANFGKIIPKDILKIPKHGCLNLHPSLLPKYRGSTPVQSAILNGDKETGISLILMDEKIDHGPILAQTKTAIGPNETAEQLGQRLALMGSDLLISFIPEWTKGEKNIIPQEAIGTTYTKILELKDEEIDWTKGEKLLSPQEETKATYTKILTRKDGEIDWKKPAQEIERQIRAFYPWPGTYTFHKGKRIKILKAKLKKGKLIIEEVQPEGKRPMSFKDFLLGHKDFKIPC